MNNQSLDHSAGPTDDGLCTLHMSGMNSVSSALSATFSKFLCFSLTHRDFLVYIYHSNKGSSYSKHPLEPLERFHLGSENCSHTFPTHILCIRGIICAGCLIKVAACVVAAASVVAHGVTSKKQKIAKCPSRVSSLSRIDIGIPHYW